MGKSVEKNVEKSEEELENESGIMSLEQFVKKSRKTFGKDSIIDLKKDGSWGDIIPSSSFSLNNALGIGGIAKNKITVFDGDSGSGKSTTGYDILGHCQKKYSQPVLLLDKERSATLNYLHNLGVDTDESKLVILNPKTLEEMYEAILLGLRSKAFGAILVDSVTAFAPDARYEGSEQMGLESRINSDKMRFVNDAIPNSDTALILIQQIRQGIGQMGDPTTVNGGLAIPFYAHVRVRITRSKIDRELQQNIMKFTIIKNKMSVPFKVGTVVYNWVHGFDAGSELAELAIELGVIENVGKSYFIKGFNEDGSDLKFVGKKKVIEFLNENLEYRNTKIQPLVEEKLKSTDLRKDEVDESEISH